MTEALVPVIVGALSAIALVGAALLTRRSSTEDRGLATLQAALDWQGDEIKELRAEMATARAEGAAARAEAAECHRARDLDRRMITDLQHKVRRLEGAP